MTFEIIGMLAAGLTTASFIPQVIKVLKTKDTHSISLMMYACFVTGVGLWIIYGLYLASWPIIIANLITFILASIILLMKLNNTWRKSD